jgi:hypothetical protein
MSDEAAIFTVNRQFTPPLLCRMGKPGAKRTSYLYGLLDSDPSSIFYMSKSSTRIGAEV